MSARVARGAVRPGRGIRIRPRVIAGSVFALLVVVIAAVAAWPVYRSGSFVLMVAGGSAMSAAVAAAARWRRWNGWLVAGALALALLVVGVPLAVPSRLGAPIDWLRGVGDVAAGVVFGFKDLVTVELPVGSYRNLLVPALVVFLVGTCALLLLAWRGGAVAYAAVPVAVGMVSFGLLFGRATASDPLRLGPFTLYAPVETAVGVAALVTCLLWLAWRTHDRRVRALEAAAASGALVTPRASSADRRRTALGAGIVAFALLVAVAVVPFAARGAERDVLRSAVGPDLDLAAAPSPLAEYRALFADDRAADVVFTVAPAAAGELPERVRVATLDAYDGEVFRSGDGPAGRFVRLPSPLDGGAGREVAARIEIGEWGGIWMPTAGRLESVEFAGGRAPALADGFYYSSAASAGVQAADGGLREGDVYVVRGVEPARAELSSLGSPGGATGTGDVAAPAGLRAWMDEHATGADGAALAGLITLLRERGYLSHGLSLGETAPVWTEALGDYTFQPSASGHSLARVDAMFSRLLEREGDPRATASGNQVAAVGDDEQFAVAAALMAHELGFSARVVLGARLTSPEPGLATCDEGVCRAQDLAVWTEVRSADGRWVAIDVTPQHAQSPSLDVTQQRDPENVTEVRPDPVEEVVPPDPAQEDSAADDEAGAEDGIDLAWLWPVMRVAAIVLLIAVVVLGPFAVVVGAKAVRRRSRRRAPDAADRIAGGWDEYVDAAVDAGLAASRGLTRTELADAFGTPNASALARDADRAVFSRSALSEEDADAYWRAVDLERGRLIDGHGLWRGLAATVSWRSLLRPIASPAGARPRNVERRRREAPAARPSP